MGWQLLILLVLFLASFTHILHTILSLSMYKNVRSFCSIYVDNFKSKVFPYMKSVVLVLSYYYSHHWHDLVPPFLIFFCVSPSIPGDDYYMYSVLRQHGTQDDDIKFEHREWQKNRTFSVLQSIVTPLILV
jgi:hypothetical protein